MEPWITIIAVGAGVVTIADFLMRRPNLFVLAIKFAITFVIATFALTEFGSILDPIFGWEVSVQRAGAIGAGLSAFVGTIVLGMILMPCYAIASVIVSNVIKSKAQ
jgi:uncharacterized membrane protein